MAGIVKSLAVVLKRMDYSDTSRIVTLLCRDEGKTSVLAKGARGRRSKFGAALEPGTLSQVVYYVKAGRELQTLAQADVVERFTRTHSTMASLAGSLHMLDIAQAGTEAGHPVPDLFDLLVSALRAADARPDRIRTVVDAFRLKTASVSGAEPVFDRCIRCGRVPDLRTVRELHFDVPRGGLVCTRCRASSHGGRPEEGRVRLSPPSLERLQRLLATEPGAWSDMDDPDEAWNETEVFLRYYERVHVLHGRTLKSEPLTREFLRS